MSEISTLLDYCEGRGEFSEISDYVGMEASKRTMLLPNYIRNADSGRQKMLLSDLLSGVLGKIPELEPYIALLTHALMMLAVMLDPALLEFARLPLEIEYADQENTREWLRAVNNEKLPNSILFKKTWHYALLLSRILHAVGSTSAHNTALLLKENAVSEQLRTQLASLYVDPARHREQN